MKTVYDFARDAGLSTSPSYYSGRGATTSDLNGMHLDRIYESIRFYIGQPAATQFAIMVAETPVLSATDFLLNLFTLARNEWVWDSRFISKADGINIDSEGSAFGTVMSVFGGPRRDQTDSIRSSFLHQHSKEIPATSMPKPKNNGWPDSYFGY